MGLDHVKHFRRRGVEFPSEYNCPQVPTAEFAAAVSSEMLNKFLDGETDKVELIYTQFVSLIASSPSIRTILPLSATGIETEGDEIFEMSTKDGDFEVETTTLGAAEPAGQACEAGGGGREVAGAGAHPPASDTPAPPSATRLIKVKALTRLWVSEGRRE